MGREGEEKRGRGGGGEREICGEGLCLKRGGGGGVVVWGTDCVCA